MPNPFEEAPNPFAVIPSEEGLGQEAVPAFSGDWAEHVYRSVTSVTPVTFTPGGCEIAATPIPCVLCNENINVSETNPPRKWESFNWRTEDIWHIDCMSKLPKCRACKTPLYDSIHRIETHPSNPRLKYHRSCLTSVYRNNGSVYWYHPTWKFTDHLGNKFSPEKHGLAVYKARVRGGGGEGATQERMVAVKTMMKLKKAGIIKRAEVISCPSKWGNNRVDHFGDSREPRFINSEGKTQGAPAADPNGYEYVGCELEVEKGELFKEALLKKKEIARIHASVGDGSLTRGVEVLTMPSAGRQLIKTLTTVTDALKSMGWEGTNHCGAHSHVNFRKSLSKAHIKRAMMLCRKLEPFILDRIAPRRRNEHYCQPLHKSWDLSEVINTPADRIDELVYGTDNEDELAESKEDKYCDARYSGVNFHSIFFRGTLEFRYLEGTTDPKRLSQFGLLYAGIVEELHNDEVRWGKFWSKALSAQPEEIVGKLMRTPSIRLLKRISPEFIK